MDSLEGLNAQQRAVLALLLRQGKSYDEIAAMLHSDPAAIRRRAQGAVGALAPADAGVPEDRRNEVADYLLGQQTASQRAATREYLEGSAAGRGWARAASGALAQVGGAEKLPDVPAEPEEVAEAFGALQARISRQEEVQRSAKRGNALMSAGLGLLLAIVIIVVVALISSGGDDNSGADNAAATTTPPAATTSTPPAATTPTGDATSTTPSATDPNGNPQILAQGVLQPPSGSGSKASGQVAIVLFPNSRRYRLALTAKGVPPSSASGSAYGVWFYTDKRNKVFLGFPDKKVGPNGQLDTVADLSPDTPNFREVLLTSETAQTPKTPGAVILRARLVTARPASSAGGATTTP
jgi:hypothetical protein